MNIFPHRPDQGLYRHDFEHDACGVAFVARLSGEPSHEIVAQGLLALENLDHRGATGADERAGDGAGMLLQIPDALFRETVDFETLARLAMSSIVFTVSDPIFYPGLCNRLHYSKFKQACQEGVLEFR